MEISAVAYLVVGAIAAIGVALVLRGNLQTSRQGQTAKSAKLRSARKTPTVPKNPYRATSIVCGENACAEAKTIDGKRFLVDDTPQLPLSLCDAERCDCKYAHHEDRRDDDGGDRRGPDTSLRTTLYQHEETERRGKRGRRASDWEDNAK